MRNVQWYGSWLELLATVNNDRALLLNYMFEMPAKKAFQAQFKGGLTYPAFTGRDRRARTAVAEPISNLNLTSFLSRSLSLGP